MATITANADIAHYLAASVAGNGAQVTHRGGKVTLDQVALDLLGDLGPTFDGHYDGKAIYIGGDAYPVSR